MKKSILILSSALLCFNTVTKAQTITTVVGNGTAGYTGDGGPAVSAELYSAYGTFFDPAGNMYIADALNHRIRKVSTSGIITTIAGTGTAGYSGDGGSATLAKLYRPTDIVLDAAGNLYISDELNNCIRKIDTAGIISTIAGIAGMPGYSGDGGQAGLALIQRPNTISIDVNNNIYFSDYQSNVIRKIDTSGIITTVIGNGSQGYSGDGGPATAASLYEPCKVAFDNAGNLYVADEYNQVVRKVDASGIITTFAGNGVASFGGDGGPATSASIGYCEYIQVDASGNLYLSDKLNNRVRKVNTSGIISTVVGSGTQGYSGDGGLAIAAAIDLPEAITFDASGNMFLTDWGNNAIRKIVSSTPCSSSNIVTITGDSTTCAGSTIKLFANGASVYTWSSNTAGGSSDSTTANPLANTVYSVSGIDTNGCLTSPASFSVSVTNGCVWPGDADENLTVDAFDLLTIGLEYGKTGSARSTTSINWQGYPCTNWADTLLINGKNAKYADCNGDSIVDLNDTTAILINYNQNHTARLGGINKVQTWNPDIYLTFNKNNYVAGDTVIASVNIGNSSNVQNNFYGTAFSINYDITNVISGSEIFSFSNSWIGNTNQFIHLSKIFSSQGVLDAAIVRTSHTDASGFGQIATFSFILKNTITSNAVNFTINNGVKINHSSNQLPLASGTDSVSVSSTTSITNVNSNSNIFIYPNPASGIVNIQVLNASENSTYKLYNSIGQELKNGSITQGTNQINLQDLASGIYTVVILQNGKISTSKISIQK